MDVSIAVLSKQIMILELHLPNIFCKKALQKTLIEYVQVP